MEKTVEITPEDIETLIAEERAPFKHGKVKTESRGGRDAQEFITFWIPPQGTQEGDTISGSNGRGFTFTSPTGEVRGMAEMRTVPLKEGRLVERRMWDVQRASGVDKSSTVAYMFRKARAWIEDNL